MAQTQILSQADAAQLRRDLCLAYDSRNEALLHSLSKQIDQLQLILWEQTETQSASSEN